MPLYKRTYKFDLVIHAENSEVARGIFKEVCDKYDGCVVEPDSGMKEIKTKEDIPAGWGEACPFLKGDYDIDDIFTCNEIIEKGL